MIRDIRLLLFLVMTCHISMPWTESQHKQQAQSKAVPTSGSLDRKFKIQGTQ